MVRLINEAGNGSWIVLHIVRYPVIWASLNYVGVGCRANHEPKNIGLPPDCAVLDVASKYRA